MAVTCRMVLLIRNGPASLTFWFFYEKEFRRFLRYFTPVRHTFFFGKKEPEYLSTKLCTLLLSQIWTSGGKTFWTLTLHSMKKSTAERFSS